MSESDIVREWLKYLGLDRYYDNFVDNGYDDLEMCKQIGDPDLDAIGVTELDHRLTIHRAVKTLLEKGGTSVYISIEEFSKIRDDISKSHNISPENAKHRKYFGSRHSDPKESGFHPETIGEQLTPSPLEAAIADILESKGVHFNNEPSANKDGLQVELDFLATEIQKDLPSGKNIAQTDIIEVLERIRRRGVTSGKSSSLPRDCPTKPWSSHPGDWHPSQHRSASSLLSFSRFLNSNSRSMDKDLNITARKESGDFRKELKKKAGFGKLFRSLSTSQTSPKHMSKTDILKQNSDTDRSLSMPQKPGEGQLKMVNFPEKNFIGKACHTHFAGEVPKSKKNKNKMIKELGRAMSWSSREIKEKEKKNYVSLTHSDESNSGNVGNSPRGDTHSALPSKVQPAQRPTSFFRTSNHMFDGYSCMSVKRRSGAEEAPTDTCRGDCGNIMCGLSPVKLDESAQQDCYRKLSSIEKPGSDDKEVDIDTEFCPRRRTKSESCCSSNRRNIYNVDTLSTNLMCARDRSSDGYSSYPASDASTVNEGFCTVVCQAVALVDYLPNPYDKDSLTLKKGDIVDILAKFDSGYWIGRSGDKIGHVKFVNLKEVDAYERNRDADLTSPSSLQEKLLTLEDFLEQLGLANYLNIFVMNGYHNINSLKLITKQDLVDMKIDDTERQEMLLSAIKQLKERNPEHDRCNCCTYLAPCKSMEKRNFFRNMDPHNPSPEYFSSGTACSHSHFLEKRNDDLERSSVLENVKFYSSDRLCSKDSCHGTSDPDNFRSKRAVPDRDTVNDLGDNFKKSCHIESERANNVQKVTESVPDFRRNTSNLNIPPYQSSLESTHCGSNAIIIAKENSFDTIQSQNENRTYPTKAIARPYGTITLDEFLESRRKMASEEEEEPIVDEQVQFPVSKRDFLSRFSRNGSWLNKAENDVHPQDRKSKSILGYRKLSLKSPISEISASADALDFVTLPRAKKSSVEDMRLATCDAFYYRTERKSKRRMRRKKDRSKSSTIPSPQSYTLQDLVGQKLRDEDIDLCSEPYTDKTGFCGIPPALVQRYADELQQDIFDIAEALDHERMYLLQNQGKAAVPNDFLADSCCEPVIAANYSSLSDWLISIGLPIYEKTLSKAGYSELYHIADLTDREMRHCGIHNDRHVRLLKTAIEALHIQFEHHGYIT